MIEGETVATGAPGKCNDQGCPGASGPKVLQSAAGFYIGYFCDGCGPYSRESGYYATDEEAAAALQDGYVERDNGFNPESLRVFPPGSDSARSEEPPK